MKLLVKGGHVVDPSTGLNQICDILIDNGRIAAVGQSLATPEEHCSTLDASGLVVAPGLVDLHVHLSPVISHFSLLVLHLLIYSAYYTRNSGKMQFEIAKKYAIGPRI